MVESGWGELAGNAILAGIVVWTGLRGRKKQNDKLGQQIDQALGTRVAGLEEAVSGLKAVISAETSKIAHLDKTMGETRAELATIKSALPRVESVLEGTKDVLAKTLNFYERIKGKTLEEKPIPGTGMTALKSKKED